MYSDSTSSTVVLLSTLFVRKCSLAILHRARHTNARIRIMRAPTIRYKVLMQVNNDSVFCDILDHPVDQRAKPGGDA
jgi:hypothetical protein